MTPLVMRAPVPIVTPLTSATGRRRANQGPGHPRSLHLHGGVDLPTVMDEPVLAMAPGRVTEVVYQHASGSKKPADMRRGIVRASELDLKAPYGQGLFVRIAHDFKLPGFEGTVVSAYNHLNTAIVRQGQRVRAGQVLGGAGKSGTNPIGGAVHLHFAVQVGDPEDVSERVVLDPRGFINWSSDSDDKRPGRRAWRASRIVVVRAFPRSGSNRGREGVDPPSPAEIGGVRVAAQGGGLVGLPVFEATDLIVLAAGAALAYYLVT